MCGMDNSSAGCAKVGYIETHRLQRPAGRAIAAAKATPYILMRIDKEGDAMFPCFLRDLVDIVKIVLVIKTRPRMFNRLPGDEQAHKGEAPRAQAREMLVRLAQRKRSPHKRDAPVIEEVLTNIRCAIRRKGNLAAPSQIDAA